MTAQRWAKLNRDWRLATVSTLNHHHDWPGDSSSARTDDSPTMTNKPRNSVLYLFDPLESVTTPRRDGSPDSISSSDKENDVQPGEVTMFFNRIYTSHKNVAPKTPNGKLIDFGDTTTDDVWGLEEENAPSSAGVLDTAKQPVETTSDRIPLADIEIEEPTQPIHTEAAPATSPFGEEEDAAPLRSVSAAPTGAPLADVINSINLSAMDISGSEPPSPLANRSPLPPLKEEADADDSDAEDEDFEARHGEPEDTVCIPLLITVSSPTGTYEESNSLTDMVLPPSSESPTDRLFASSNVDVPPPTRRPLLKTRVANDDPRRASVDLQASFSMQMQSAEMSFDLLNDRISFQAGDSMWVGGDDEDEAFDMAAEMKKMEAAANAFERAEQVKKDDMTMEIGKGVRARILCECFAEVCVDAAPAAGLAEHKEGHDDDEWAGPSLDITSPPSSLTDKLESPKLSATVATPPKVFELAQPSASSNGGTLTKRDRNLSIQMLMGSPTPAPVSRELSPPPAAAAPAPVPALRIVKKTWKVHGRTDSGTSSGSSMSSGSTGTLRTRSISPDTSVASDSVPSLKEDKAAPAPVIEAPRPRTVVRGVQRPPAGAEVSGNRVVVPAASASTATSGPVRATVAASTTQAKSRASLAREASARFAAAGLQRPNLQQGQRAPPPAPAHKAPARAQRAAVSSVPAVPRPTSIGRSAGAGVAARVAGTSGLKAPVASGIPSSKSSSALPRPASRLPAPSAGSRVAKPSAPAARAPSSGARRAF